MWFLGLGLALTLIFCEAPASAKGPRVLFIGDSHGEGSFGRALEKRLRSTAGPVGFYASCGSNPVSWIRGNGGGCGYRERDPWGGAKKRPALPRGQKEDPIPKLSKLLDSVKPRVTIVQLGANLIRTFNEKALKPKPDDGLPCIVHEGGFDRPIQTIMRGIAARKSSCIWIGPPHSRKFIQRCYHEVNDRIRTLAEARGCEFIDMAPIQKYPDTGGDGLHYDYLPSWPEITRRMANAAFAQIAEKTGWDTRPQPERAGDPAAVAEEPLKLIGENPSTRPSPARTSGEGVR